MHPRDGASAKLTEIAPVRWFLARLPRVGRTKGKVYKIRADRS
jgi:hypothetical protein